MHPLITRRLVVLKRVYWPAQLALIFALLLLANCRNEPSSSLYFPKYDLVNGEWVRMTGAIEGELVKTGDCLRLFASPSNTSYLVVWPPGYELDEDGSEILIRDNSGQVVARVGEEVFMGGGGEERETFDGVPGVSEQLAVEIKNSGCPGPYWFSGGVILDQDE
jgi:hypothetical protein